MSTSTSTLLLSLSVLFLLDIATIVQPVHGLKCYSQTFNGTDEGDRVEEICQNDDKYCVDFGGSLSLIGNMTVAFRSCEKTLTKHLQPLIDIIGKIPEVECKGNNKTEGSAGPLKYWYECCSDNLCNQKNFEFNPNRGWSKFQSATSVTAHALMFSVTAFVVFNKFITGNKF